MFTEIALQYLSAGYVVIPLTGKIPMMPRWQNTSLEIAEILADNAKYESANIGVLCGEPSNIIALDLDNYADLHPAILRMVPPSPVRKKGAKGQTLFYRYSGESSWQFSLAGQVVVDVLSTGRQTVLPPSIHPDTQAPYEWLTDETLTDYTAEQLPELGQGAIDAIRDFIESKQPQKKQTEASTQASVYEFLSLLEYYDCDSRDDWVEVIRIAAFEFGTDEAFNYVDLWSRKSSKYKNTSDVRKTWDSFKHEKTSLQTIGSMRFRAQASCPIAIPAATARPAPIVSQIEFPAGLVGDVATWITDTAYKPQPMLSLAAALCLVGTCKAHRVQSETGLRTNNFFLGIAESASGKEHPQHCVSEALIALGQDKLLLGCPASDSGLIGSLSTSGGTGCILWDEIGHAIGCMTDRNAAGHEKKIMSMLMQIFSKANTRLTGKEFADRKMDRTIVDQPCLNLFGATTPTRFYEAISGGYIADGFLPRFLVFSAERGDVAKNRNAKALKVPQSITHALTDILNMPTDASPVGNIPRISPAVIPFSAQAKVYADELDAAFDATTNAHRGKDDARVAIWGRAYQHAVKLALVVSGGQAIELDAITWAGNTVQSLLEASCVAVDRHTAGSEFERETKRVLDWIAKEHNGITRKQIYNRIKNRYNAKTLESYIQHLKATGQIAEAVLPTSTKSQILYFATDTQNE